VNRSTGEILVGRFLILGKYRDAANKFQDLSDEWRGRGDDREIVAGSSSRGIHRWFNALDADTFPVRNTTGLLDSFDIGNSALVERHFLNRCESS